VTDRVCKTALRLVSLTGGEEIYNKMRNVHFLNLCWAQILSMEECPGGIVLFSLEKRKMGEPKGT